MRRTMLALVLVGCGPTAATVEHLPLELPPPSDTSIVPGRRAGVVEIGMTEADLFQYAGNPVSNHPSMSADTESVYEYASYQAWVGHDGHVDKIVVTDPAYSLPSGVHVGSSALEMKAKLGEPAWASQVNAYNYTSCYQGDSAVIMLASPSGAFESVSEIEVCGCHAVAHVATPGCWN